MFAWKSLVSFLLFGLSREFIARNQD